MTPPLYHHDVNDTRHWSPERAAAAAKEQRIRELQAKISYMEDYHGYRANGFIAELDRISALTPLQYAAEIAEQDSSPDTLAAGLDAAGFGSGGPM